MEPVPEVNTGKLPPQIIPFPAQPYHNPDDISAFPLEIVSIADPQALVSPNRTPQIWSLREIFAVDEARGRALLEAYYPKFVANFQDPDERFPIESVEAHIRRWKDRGSLALDCWYAQHSLGPGLNEVDYVLLAIKSLSNSLTHVSRDVFLSIYERMYEVLNPGQEIERDPTFAKLLDRTNGLERIPLVPLDQPRSFITSNNGGGNETTEVRERV